MKKIDALEWYDRILRAATSLSEQRALGAVQHNGRLVFDELEDEACWAGRWALDSWPFVPDQSEQPTRPGLRFEVWFRPGRNADIPITLMLLCAGEPALAPLRTHLSSVWNELLKSGKTAGRYQSVEQLDKLALRFDGGAQGIGRHVSADWRKVEPALERLMLDTHKVVSSAVDAWRQAGSEIAFNSPPTDPFQALRNKFAGE